MSTHNLLEKDRHLLRDLHVTTRHIDGSEFWCSKVVLFTFFLLLFFLYCGFSIKRSI